MIVALEGPDLCGKTTVFNRLVVPDAVMYPGLPMDPELLPHMAAVEARQEAVWQALYDPARLYVCDRHFVVTSLVYSQLYGRQHPDYSRWIPELRVLYFHVPAGVLLARYRDRGDRIARPEQYSRVLELYGTVLEDFRHVKLAGTEPPEVLAEECARWIRHWRHE